MTNLEERAVDIASWAARLRNKSEDDVNLRQVIILVQELANVVVDAMKEKAR